MNEVNVRVTLYLRVLATADEAEERTRDQLRSMTPEEIVELATFDVEEV